MKKILFFTLLLCNVSAFAQYDFQNIQLLGRFDDVAVNPEPTYGIRYQSCWGWTGTGGKEYGIIGSTAGTYIIEVTDPSNPVQRDYVPHYQSDLIWHEYKTYGNYLYIISDDAGTNTLQIADLSYLPDSVHVVYDGTSLFVHSHTLFIDGDKMYVASVSGGPGGFSAMNVYSLANPALPVLLRKLNQDYNNINSVHDIYVTNDTIYANCGYQGLFIYRYDETLNRFIQLGSMTSYIDQGYNHSCFASDDRSTLYICEEVPDGKSVKVVDITDVANPSVIDTFYNNAGCTPHNPYVKGDFLYIAYYMDGLIMYDISNPATPVKVGYFDTYPNNAPGSYPAPAYKGAWAVYTDLPSGTVLVSDMQRGLFCLDASTITGIRSTDHFTFNVYPNPANDHFSIRLPQTITGAQLEMTDLTGRVVRHEPIGNLTTIEKGSLPEGIYFITIACEAGKMTRIVILN